MASLRTSTFLRPLLAVIALLVVPLAGCGDDDDATTAEGTSTTTTTTDDTTTTTGDTTTTRPGDAPPEQIAAVLADGTLALLDGVSGETRQTLLEGIDVSDPAKNGITITPDGDEVFVVRPAGDVDDDHEIVRVPVDGGEPAVVARGRAPAVSPDGTTLAYVEVESDPSPGQPEPVIVLHDLETGDERRLERQDEPGYHFIVDMGWTSDGDQLAFVSGEIQTGLNVVDADADTLDDARRLGPDARGEGTSWTAVTAFDDERLAVVETCCGVPDEERWHLVAVHVETGTVEGTLLPEERVEAYQVDSDASDRHLVLVADVRPGGGTLLRWSSPTATTDGTSGTGDGIETVRDGVVVAAW